MSGRNGIRLSSLPVLIATALVAACLFAQPAQGQGLVQAVGSGPSSPPAPGPKVFTLTVAPAAQPEPALRYLLLPDLPDTTPGNAALLYHRAMELCPSREDGNVAERIIAWLDLPADRLEKLPPSETKEVFSRYSSSLRELELAARRDKCDWDLPISEGINMLMPSLSKYRELGRVLALRARLHVADGHYDDAIHALQTGYAMARHVSEGPTLIESLVGMAVAGLMNQATMELMQSKGGPNLYWAIARLPRPFIGIRSALEYERTGWLASTALMRKAAYGEPLAPHEAAALQVELSKFWNMLMQANGWSGDGEGQMRAQLPFTAASIRIYPAAKKHLARKGFTAEQIEKMPVAQVVAVYSLGRYFHWRDELFKWHALPWPVAAQGFAKADQAFREVSGKPEEGWPFTMLLPGLSRVGFMEARLSRQLGAMMAIEAVRLHAAAHDGKAPATLDELTDSPVLPDPVTGKPFQYQRTEDGFVITCPAPAGGRFSPQDSEVYKVTLR